ncbi:hypothetical protein L1987_50706 [Smallanthus sonchifolius]|uniref:Uncharacterized protein n=1 Tax=Smallanthus sonchifolius TaxID=185202 RepID=A0ACB9EN80_9ASTR|nr:hypothetical protein L1987_50706 [Smallanthus sonchifolius]
MASLTIAVILLSVLLSGSFFAVEVNGDSGGDGGAVELVSTVAEQREFDYFALAVQWPATYCSKSTKCCTQNGCCRGENSPSGFTIHGLWPDYNDGSWPSCCSGPAFDETEISSLLSALDKYWPTLSCSKSSTCHNKKGLFWAHEWGKRLPSSCKKHGTCSSSVTGDEYNYFITTLNLYFKYNVTEVLFEAGYVPSNSEKYPSAGIISAIENAFHTNPQLVCLNGALEEVRLCLTKDFKFRECVAGSDCPEYVSLPEFASLDVTKTAGGLISGADPAPFQLSNSIHKFLRGKSRRFKDLNKEEVAMGYAQLVIGPAGSGKSTYCSSLHQHCEATGRAIHIVNLDPAAENFDYPVAMDIRELISLDDVMEELGLGPNGGLLYCMEHLEENLDEWLSEELENYMEDDYLVFDCPGQIELFSHVPGLKNFVEHLQRKNFNVCAVYLLDSQFITDVTKFISGCMASLSAMVQLELPHVNILSKMDLVTRKRDIEDYLNPEPQTLLAELNQRMGPQFQKLNKALIELVDQYSMVSFVPLDLRKESSIQYVLSQIDNCIQFGEDADVKIKDFDEDEDQD